MVLLVLNASNDVCSLITYLLEYFSKIHFIYCKSKAMKINQIAGYIHSNEHIGLDKVFKLLLKIDRWVASKIGLSSLSPIGFIFGFLACYLIFVA